MKEILDLQKLDNIINDKFKAISIANEKCLLNKDVDTSEILKNILYNRTIDYLSLLQEQYEVGILGYMIFPYFITSLLKFDSIYDFVEIENVIDLASSLEIPNTNGTETTPKTRLDVTEQLSDMIEKIKIEGYKVI